MRQRHKTFPEALKENVTFNFTNHGSRLHASQYFLSINCKLHGEGICLVKIQQGSQFAAPLYHGVIKISRLNKKTVTFEK